MKGNSICNDYFLICLPFSITVLVLPSSIYHQRQNLRTIIVIADIHQGLQQSPYILANIKRRWLTFWHWSGVTPYTSSCEFAGSCVFGKQLPEKLSLRPLLREASLIPRLRLLFCRVPWGNFTRSPCSARADYLCRISVRIFCCINLETFLGSAL